MQMRWILRMFFSPNHDRIQPMELFDYKVAFSQCRCGVKIAWSKHFAISFVEKSFQIDESIATVHTPPREHMAGGDKNRIL